MDLAALGQSQTSALPGETSPSSFDTLGSAEFFELIITDLLNQNPLEPTDNEKLLQQISAIRDMELNQQLTTSLRTLMDQQRFASATSLIGQYVESNEAVDESGQVFASGVVVGISFGEDGQPILRLDNGATVALTSVKAITSLERLGELLVGKMVTAEIVSDGELKTIEGVVTEIKKVDGRVWLELDSGQQVAVTDEKEQRSLAS